MLELWPRGLPKMHEALVARLAWTWPVELDILLIAGASPGSVQHLCNHFESCVLMILVLTI